MNFDRKTYMRNYQREWVARRRAEWIETNGPCSQCGSTENLEIDHIDRSTKLHNPGTLWSRKAEVREAELAKCHVLCEKCHQAKTTEEKRVSHPCGTLRAYWRGCRCNPCRAESAKEARQRRARRCGSGGEVPYQAHNLETPFESDFRHQGG